MNEKEDNTNEEQEECQEEQDAVQESRNEDGKKESAKITLRTRSGITCHRLCKRRMSAGNIVGDTARDSKIGECRSGCNEG